MIKIENCEVLGWEHAIRGLRNPKNSWDKSDTMVVDIPDTPRLDYYGNVVEIIPAHKQVVMIRKEQEWNGIGENDLKLMKSLCKAGTDHRKFMRMITVYVDITAPLYWWKEFDTYKVGTVANSCSTMHKITSKPIELSDFSIDNIYICDDYAEISLEDMFINVVADCESLRQKYLETNDKRYWKGLIQLLPTSYNQKRTVMLNYEVLANMYKSRKNHKLDEWVDFCKWIESLPYSELITGGKEC